MIFNDLLEIIRKDNEKWWVDITTGAPKERNIGELLMLAVSELAEALEGHRKNLQDDKLPQYKMFDVELADTIIRILDTCGHYNIPIEEIILAKLEYNRHREDHTHAARLEENGKKY